MAKAMHHKLEGRHDVLPVEKHFIAFPFFKLLKDAEYLHIRTINIFYKVLFLSFGKIVYFGI